MRLVLVTSLAAASLLAAASPVGAASFDQRGSIDVRSGTFAGARLRVPLGGGGRARPKAQFGLTVAPMLRGQLPDGQVQLRFGEGVAFGFLGGQPQLSLIGMSLTDRLSAVQDAEEKKDSTGKKVLKGAAVVAIVAVGVVGGLILAYNVACSNNRCSE